MTLNEPLLQKLADWQMPRGGRQTLLRLRAPRPEWYRRYWLVDPIDLPKGTVVEVVAMPASADAEPVKPTPGPLAVAIDYVPR